MVVLIRGFLLAGLVSLLPLAAAADRYVELDWDELMPADWIPPDPFADFTDDQLYAMTDDSPEARELMQALDLIRTQAPIVKALDGRSVRLPGFVVPFEFDGTLVSEFLLVPYYGACIHVPPPPANQMVYVSSEQGVRINGLFDIVWVDGTLHADAQDSMYGLAGYTLKADAVSPYEYEE